MCTLAIAHRVFENTPIAVAANRDESVDRPSSPPTRYLDDPVAIAPVDEEVGGTWIGYNEHGLFVGITNRWIDRPSGRSRGLLVRDCLHQRSAGDARSTVASAIDADEYAGFNLIVADRDEALLLEWDGDLSCERFDPGVHVVANVGANGAYVEPDRRPAFARRQAKNVAVVRQELGVAPGDAVDRRNGRIDGPEDAADRWLDRAGTVLGTHEFGVCIHRETFGTRSSSLIALTETDEGFTDRYEFADGPPCRTAFRPVTASIDP